LDTCAVDGLCATACPVDINTGDLVKRLRRENHSDAQNKFALFIAQNFKTVEWGLRTALKIGFGINKIFGKQSMFRLTKMFKKVIPEVPLWSQEMSYPPQISLAKNSITQKPDSTINIVYFPACISRMLGTYQGKEKNLMETFLSICEKANIGVKTLDKLAGSCCSQIYSSKGFKSASDFTANDIIERVWFSSNQGALPVVIDVSSCAYTLHNIRPALNPENQTKFDQLTILDSVVFLHDYVKPVAKIRHKRSIVTVHTVCSVEKMKTVNKFVDLAKHFATDVIVPKHGGCCGMAGDRGFLFPELTDSATLPEALEVKQYPSEGYYSSTKTCEIAMSKAVSQNYESILYLIDEAL